MALARHRPNEPLPDSAYGILRVAREPTNLGDGKKPIKGEMWFGVTD